MCKGYLKCHSNTLKSIGVEPMFLLQRERTTVNLSVNATEAAKYTLRGLLTMLRLHNIPISFHPQRGRIRLRPACKLWIYPYSRNLNPIKRNGAHFFFLGEEQFLKNFPFHAYRICTVSLGWTPSALLATILFRKAHIMLKARYKIA